MVKCYLCSCEDSKVRHTRVRDNDKISVLECTNCGLVYLSTFNHISNVFYEESGMINGVVNLDVYRKNSHIDDSRRACELNAKILGKKVLDFGCGGGGFLHLLSNVASKVSGIELDTLLDRNLILKGFHVIKD